MYIVGEPFSPNFYWMQGLAADKTVFRHWLFHSLLCSLFHTVQSLHNGISFCRPSMWSCLIWFNRGLVCHVSGAVLTLPHGSDSWASKQQGTTVPS